MEVGDNANINVLDLENKYTWRTTKATKKADFNFNMNTGDAPDNKNYTGDGFNVPDYYYDDELNKPDGIRIYSDDGTYKTITYDNRILNSNHDNFITETISGISLSLSDVASDLKDLTGIKFIDKNINKQISKEKIEKNITKLLKLGINALAKKLDNSLNKDNNGNSNKDNEDKDTINNNLTQQKIEKLCGKKCKVKTFGDTETEVVNSVIKFGE